MKIIVIGGGAWGTALAINAARHAPAPQQVWLWLRDPVQATHVRSARANSRYLPGVPLPESLQIRDDALAQLLLQVTAHDLVILASPMAGLRGLLGTLRDCPAALAWLCKGFELSQDGAPGLLGHEIQHAVAPKLRAGVFSGPSFAQEVAEGLPTAMVAASAHASVRDALVAAFPAGTAAGSGLSLIGSRASNIIGRSASALPVTRA